MKFDRTDTVDGLPIARVREFLRMVRGSMSDKVQIDDVVEFFALDQPAAERLLAEMLRRRLAKRSRKRASGFRDPDVPLHEIGSAGSSLCAALFLPAISRATADRLVTGLLERTQAAAAARQDHLVEVTGLAIFGSYRTEASQLHDVDVLWDYRRLPELDHRAFTERAFEMFARDRRHPRRIGDEGQWPFAKLKRFLVAHSRYIRLHWLNDAKVIKTPVRVVYQLPQGRLTPPYECTAGDFAEAVAGDRAMTMKELRRRLFG